jgi:hypothetical protein
LAKLDSFFLMAYYSLTWTIFFIMIKTFLLNNSIKYFPLCSNRIFPLQIKWRWIILCSILDFTKNFIQLVDWFRQKRQTEIEILKKGTNCRDLKFNSVSKNGVVIWLAKCNLLLLGNIKYSHNNQRIGLSNPCKPIKTNPWRPTNLSLSRCNLDKRQKYFGSIKFQDIGS